VRASAKVLTGKVRLLHNGPYCRLPSPRLAGMTFFEGRSRPTTGPVRYPAFATCCYRSPVRPERLASTYAYSTAQSSAIVVGASPGGAPRVEGAAGAAALARHGGSWSSVVRQKGASACLQTNRPRDWLLTLIRIRPTHSDSRLDCKHFVGQYPTGL
jgi:hypothetical protein